MCCKGEAAETLRIEYVRNELEPFLQELIAKRETVSIPEESVDKELENLSEYLENSA